MTAISGPHHDARAASAKDPTGSLQAGPAGAAVLAEQLQTAVVEMAKWMHEFGEFTPHPSLAVGEKAVVRSTAELRDRLRNNYPFFHRRYVGQMLKPPHPAAVIGYLSTMLINPNNHASDGGPATAQMEKEAVTQLAGTLMTSGSMPRVFACARPPSPLSPGDRTRGPTHLELVMRMLLKAVLDTQAANEVFRSGAAAEALDRIQEALQPEAPDGFVEDGQRAFFAVFDLADPSEIPVISEPLFSARTSRSR
jgi:hypothetical protein